VRPQECTFGQGFRGPGLVEIEETAGVKSLVFQKGNRVPDDGSLELSNMKPYRGSQSCENEGAAWIDAAKSRVIDVRTSRPVWEPWPNRIIHL